jgi:hypothetical protein
MHYVDSKHRSDVPVESGEAEDSVWRISHETVDEKRNNEVLVQIDVMPPKSIRPSFNEIGLGQGGLNSGEGFEMELGAFVHEGQELHEQHMGKEQASIDSGDADPCSGIVLMKGIMFEQVAVLDPRFMWQQRWCELSSSAFAVCQKAGVTPDVKVPLDQITKVHAIPDMADRNIFHIYSNGRKPIKLKAQSAFSREQWIKRISDATGRLYVADWGDIRHGESTAPDLCIPLQSQSSETNTTAKTSSGNDLSESNPSGLPLGPAVPRNIDQALLASNFSTDRSIDKPAKTSGQDQEGNSLKRLKMMDLLLSSPNSSSV